MFPIVQTAIASGRSKDPVVIGDDTDLLILLLYNAEMNAHELFLRSQPKTTKQTRMLQTRMWCIKQSKLSLDPQIYDNVLFFRLDEMIKNNPKFKQQDEVFNQVQVAKLDVVQAGEKYCSALWRWLG